jgi:hypothetical protein
MDSQWCLRACERESERESVRVRAFESKMINK